MKKYKVVNILWPQITLFVGESWQCNEFIEKKYGNGFSAIMHSVIELYPMNQENKTPHSFCETPEEKCTMNYCDENGCQNRKRHLVEENKQLPTASQSLYKWNFKLVHEDMAKCIDEHTRLHTAPLREELEKLRADKESLLVRVEEVRQINKQLEHEMLFLNRSNKELNVENLKLKSDTDRRIKGYNDLHDDLIRYRDKYDQSVQDMEELKAENQKLREALERIIIESEDNEQVDWMYIAENMVEIAKEALKGGSDE